jgi:hypothetical protein
MVNDMMLTHSEEAEIRRSMEIAQELIRMGLKIEQIVKATKLDISTVESLYTGQAQSAIQL